MTSANYREIAESLFAEMVKAKPWTRGTLRAVGGARGIGLAFLEETFGAERAPLEIAQQVREARAEWKKLGPGHAATTRSLERRWS